MTEPVSAAIDIKHGTSSSYTNHRCRCDLCRHAHSVLVARRRMARLRLLRTVDGALVTTAAVPHGDYSTYTNWHCRCVPCTGVARAYNQRYRGSGT